MPKGVLTFAPISIILFVVEAVAGVVEVVVTSSDTSAAPAAAVVVFVAVAANFARSSSSFWNIVDKTVSKIKISASLM